MITTRKMLERLFEDLQEEKRQMKANYRQDISDLESRQERLLDRMERLDHEDKDLVDVEGIMVNLSETANKLSELLPNVPMDLLLDKTAEKMAKLEPEIIQEPEKEIKMAETSAVKKGKPKDIMELIIEILEESKEPLLAREIEDEIYNRKGWQWNHFTTSFSKWRNDYPNMVKAIGRRYTVNK